MSIEIEFDNDVGVVFTLKHEFSYDEIKKAHEELFRDDKFEGIKYWIVDRRNSVNYAMTTDQVDELSRLCKHASGRNKKLMQILVSDSDLQYGVSRQYQVLQRSRDGTLLQRVTCSQHSAESMSFYPNHFCPHNSQGDYQTVFRVGVITDLF